MRVSLPYGSGALEVAVPEGTLVLTPPLAPPLPDVTAALSTALAAPSAGPPLHELARGRRSACIVISDITRPAVGPHVLPAVCEALRSAGVAAIEILIATGTHRAVTEDEAIGLVGSGVAGRYVARSHDCLDGEHDFVGVIPSGVPVWIDRGYARAELRIVLGVVEPHLMAGYSGGAKSVCPGLARLDTVRGIHRAALARANVGPGIVQGNPFRAEIAAATRLAGVEFSIQVCASRGGVPTFVSAGDLDATAAESTAFAASRACVAAGTTHEVVLTTGGGAPLDRTLYQAAKGWAAAAGVVRPGGHLLLVAQLSEGIGTRAFEAALVDSRHADAPSPVNGPDSGAPAGVGLGSWMVQHIAQLRARGRLHVVSSLPAERLEALGFGAHRTVQEALAALCPAVTERSLLILPQGPYCVPTVSGRLLTLEGAPAA